MLLHRIIIGDGISDWFIGMGLHESISIILKDLMVVLSVILLVILANYIFKKIIIKIISKIVKKTPIHYDNIILEKKVFHRLSHIAPVIIIYVFSLVGFSDNDKSIIFIQNLLQIYLTIIFILVVDAFLNAVHAIYLTFEVAKYKTIKGYIQIIKILIYFLAGIIILSIMLNKSPMYLIGGLGALTAVMMLVFKDVLTGLAASIQLSANDMIRPGDWITMSKHNADGDVLEINLTTVKVKNFDNTIVFVPTYSLVTDGFQNWRGMVSAGCRRIKRSIFIETKTIRFADAELLGIIKHNSHTKSFFYDNENVILKEAELTNLRLFILYVEHYLRHNKHINKNATLMIRMLQPNDFGVPLEIYAFANTIVWIEYEAIQNEILNHLMAVVKVFDLSIYQRPSASEQVTKVININKDQHLQQL